MTIFEEQWHSCFTGSMLFLSSAVSEHWLQPGKIYQWPHLFLIHDCNPGVRGVVPFMPALWHQYPGYNTLWLNVSTKMYTTKT